MQAALKIIKIKNECITKIIMLTHFWAFLIINKKLFIYLYLKKKRISISLLFGKLSLNKLSKYISDLLK